MSQEYLRALMKIDKILLDAELKMRVNPNNKIILELMALEKTLVYFMAALTANDTVIKKINRFQWIHRFDEDSDLLEDTVIEINQASDMTDINFRIVRAQRETLSSLISNNLNDLMKVLASVTILLTVPTMIFSFYGINLDLKGELPDFLMSIPNVVIITLIVTVISYIILKIKKML
jgi:Mg2+ and Co2+ transporter CorA